VSAGFPPAPVKISSRSANPLKPLVLRLPVVAATSPVFVDHVLMLIISPVVESIFSSPSVFSVITVSPQKSDMTFACMLSYSSGYIVLSTYAAAHQSNKSRMVVVSFLGDLEIVGDWEMADGMGVFVVCKAGVMIGDICAWNVDPGVGVEIAGVSRDAGSSSGFAVSVWAIGAATGVVA